MSATSFDVTVTSGPLASYDVTLSDGTIVEVSFPQTLTIQQSGSGSGDVVGPSSSTDNALARFDGTTGKLIQSSTVALSDTGAFTGVRSIQLTDGSNTVTLSVAVGAGGRIELRIDTSS